MAKVKKPTNHPFKHAQISQVPLPQLPVSVGIKAPLLAYACAASLLIKIPHLDRADASTLRQYLSGEDGKWLIDRVRESLGVPKDIQMTTTASFLSPNCGIPSIGKVEARAPNGPEAAVFVTAFKVTPGEALAVRVRDAMIKMLHVVRGELFPAATFHFRTLGIGGDDIGSLEHLERLSVRQLMTDSVVMRQR